MLKMLPAYFTEILQNFHIRQTSHTTRAVRPQLWYNQRN